MDALSAIFVHESTWIQPAGWRRLRGGGRTSLDKPVHTRKNRLVIDSAFRHRSTSPLASDPKSTEETGASDWMQRPSSPPTHRRHAPDDRRAATRCSRAGREMREGHLIGLRPLPRCLIIHDNGEAVEGGPPGRDAPHLWPSMWRGQPGASPGIAIVTCEEGLK